MDAWDEENGRITLSKTVSLRANMARKHALEALEALTGSPCAADDPQRASVLVSGAFPFEDTEASCVCSFSQGRLRAVELLLCGGTAQRQRETLFGFIGRQDPCPQDPRSVRLRYPFGTVWVTADPRSGDASLRVSYAVKE